MSWRNLKCTSLNHNYGILRRLTRDAFETASRTDRSSATRDNKNENDRKMMTFRARGGKRKQALTCGLPTALARWGAQCYPSFITPDNISMKISDHQSLRCCHGQGSFLRPGPGVSYEKRNELWKWDEYQISKTKLTHEKTQKTCHASFRWYYTHVIN